MESPVIVFIDDEPAVLGAFKRLLRQSHRDWETCLFQSADEALTQLSALRPWIVMSEREFPDMPAIALQEAIAERAPMAIRVILTGDTRRESLLDSVWQAHFVIRKPFERDVLENLLTRVRILHQLPLKSETLVQLGQLRSLPVLSETYHALMTELQKEEPEIAQVAALIRQDQSLVGRVLQLVNSPFFGFGARTNDIEIAVMRLGLQTIHNLVLVLELYNGDQAGAQKVADRLLQDALTVATQVGLVCDSRKMGKCQRNQCVISALLHNIGQLVRTRLLQQSGDASQASSADLLAEYELIGAYVLELWGFEPEIIDAVRHQLDDPLPPDCDPATDVLNLALRAIQGR